ncbi:cytochrome P450 family protein [Ceratobasidium sp. AG-Ba]|nr:cytochrome P450 family protein [Ceratobasidium sp. AG-Ba]
MSRPYFSRERITHFDVFDRHSNEAITKLLARSAELVDNQPTAVDFQNLVSCFAMDCATEFLFGLDVKSLDAPLAYPHAPPRNHASARFAKAFDGVMDKAIVRFRLGVAWPLFEMFWDRTRGDMDVIDEYIRPILKEKLRLKAKRSELSAEDKASTIHMDAEAMSLLDHLVLLTDDEKMIKDELLNILMAGRDTTSSLLTFACYMLASHPSVMSKLRAEIIGVVGTRSRPTFEDIKAMKYLRAFIKEVLRVFPPAPMSIREAAKSTVMRSNGKQYYVPAGASIKGSLLMLHRRRDLWGPDAEAFDPERWLDERNEKYVLANPFIFLPFGAGPRICLGQQFAYNETSFFLIRLLQRVESISLAPDAQPPNTIPPADWASAKGRKSFEKIMPKSHLTLYVAGGLWVRVKEAPEVDL